MKKIYAILVALVLVLSLASCSKVTQKYADKINEAAEAGENYTLAQVKEDLGDEAIEITLLGNGIVVAVKGCESVDEIKAQLEEGKETKGIVIVVALNKAVSAEYRVITEEDLK